MLNKYLFRSRDTLRPSDMLRDIVVTLMKQKRINRRIKESNKHTAMNKRLAIDRRLRGQADRWMAVSSRYQADDKTSVAAGL